jgi:NAD-dependent deacetylase
MADSDDGLDAAIDAVRGWIRGAERIVALTGAGISTDSGIPDFRGPQGVWTRNPAAEKMATLRYYVADAEVRRAAWRHRLESEMWRKQPNAGHRALVALERRGKLHAIITQNVDGLHQKAGSSPERMIEIHGTMADYACLACGDRGPIERVLERVRAGEDDPHCACGGILKSATISFGQDLVREDLMRMQRVAMESDLMLAIGTTLAVFPAADAVPIAKQAGARVAIVNGSPTEMDHLADALLRGPISEILGRLVADD